MHGHALHPLMSEAAAEAGRLAAEVRPEQLAGPTPCTEFDTKALVNHWVAYTSYGLERRALREPLPEDLATRDYTAEPDWAGAYRKQLDRAVAAWADPAAWEGEIDLGGSPVAADGVAKLLIAETVLHGWDLARATGGRFAVSEELAALVLAVVEENAELYRQYGGFAEAVPTAGEASALDRALAASGRDPQWAPAG
ncbi:TIGR03086 family metal-binding protein [Kitasatospora sp. NPDC006697]|uniref:TIGR03086 family metal-binding protein n=1 Tax=Kitasatospora sp. NPDC006697 TaxID=3364020 RepID=UPI0036C6F522